MSFSVTPLHMCQRGDIVICLPELPFITQDFALDMQLQSELLDSLSALASNDNNNNSLMKQQVNVALTWGKVCACFACGAIKLI